jgi:uncharacterized protein YjcR
VSPKPDIIGAEDIAAMLGVQLQTVHRWRTRAREMGADALPEPEWVIGGTPIWQRGTIVRWARKTQRLSAEGPKKLTARPRKATVTKQT